MQVIIVNPNQAGQRLDKFLHKCLPQAGTSFLYKMLRKKNITLNGKKAEGSEQLSVGDSIKFFLSDETFQKFSCSFVETDEYRKVYQQLKDTEILYEDDNIILASKAAGVLTQKAKADDFSLNEWFIGYLLESNKISAMQLSTFRPSVCNRLDRNTSGIVLCGKSLAGSQYLSRCIRERRIGKFYHTVCVGNIQKEMTVEGYLHKDEVKNKVTVTASSNNEEADYIKTRYIPLCSNGGYTLLEVELITGKTHQIRAHLASLGTPVIGDYKYGDRKVNDSLKREYHLQHQLLHAYRIEFPEDKDEIGHKVSSKSIVAPYPKQFNKIVKALNLQS